jgi:deoxyribose-phosphate aldolase
MHRDQSLDLLVEMVARRVRQELNTASAPHSAAIIIDPSILAPPPALPDEPAGLARFIDHTLLKPEATAEDIARLCDEARAHAFYSVCVNTTHVALAHTLLDGSGVKVCAVVGFPLGASTPAAKGFEARDAVRQGAAEIDMVLNIGALRSRDYAMVARDIRAVVQAVPEALVKVILEVGALTHEQKIIACAIARAEGAHFVKTSTGFGPGGATVEDIALMRAVVGPTTGVKASGGIRDRATATAMLQAGASRLGCSSSVAIVTGATGSSGY